MAGRILIKRDRKVIIRILLMMFLFSSSIFFLTGLITSLSAINIIEGKIIIEDYENFYVFSIMMLFAAIMLLAMIFGLMNIQSEEIYADTDSKALIIQKNKFINSGIIPYNEINYLRNY